MRFTVKEDILIFEYFLWKEFKNRKPLHEIL